MKTKKVKGFMLVPAVLTTILLGMVGLSFMQIFSGSLAALSTTRRGLQGQQFAQLEADILRNTAYDELESAGHDRQEIPGSNGWTSKVEIGAETTDGDVSQRMATVQIWKNATATAPDFSLQVPLSSIAGSTGGEAIGSIVARPSDRFASEAEAKQYLYCNGSNFSASQYPKLYAVLGTTALPDLRGRFLEGSDTPGIYIEAGLPEIWARGGYQANRRDSHYQGAFYGELYYDCPGSGDTDYDNGGMSFAASRCNPIYGRSTTVQPPAYTVRYYIRAK